MREVLADARHAAIREAIARSYALANNGLAVPWTGRQGLALKRLLDANKSWTLQVWLNCICNRFTSEVNLSEDPIRWLARLPDYFRCPLDKFGKPRRNREEEVNPRYVNDLNAILDDIEALVKFPIDKSFLG